MGFKVISLARGASTNFLIRLQIEEIIKYEPDLVIVGTTSMDRIEVPIPTVLGDDPYNRVNYEKLFIGDINHYDHRDMSTDLIGKHDPKLISQSLSTLVNREVVAPSKDLLNETQLRAIEDYFMFLYDPNYKRMIDSFTIADGLRLLEKNNIKYYVLNHMLEESVLEFAGDKLIPPYSDLMPQNYWFPERSPKYPFHTNEEEQDTLCDKWFEKLNS